MFLQRGKSFSAKTFPQKI